LIKKSQAVHGVTTQNEKKGVTGNKQYRMKLKGSASNMRSTRKKGRLKRSMQGKKEKDEPKTVCQKKLQSTAASDEGSRSSTPLT